MVAEKGEASSSAGFKLVSVADKVMTDSSRSESVSKPPCVRLLPSLNEEEGSSEESLEDLGEVVLSLRCKKCSFLCHDKTTLVAHAREKHRRNFSSSGSKSSNGNTEINSTSSTNETGMPLPNGFKDILSVSSKNCIQIESSDIPLSSLIGDQHKDGKKEDEAEGEGEDMFLCAECEIVFPTEELCCQHMCQVHNLKQFSAQFIREEISKGKNCASEPKKRRIRPPKQYTVEGGAVVPKKYRVTKDTYFSCSKCTVRFESSEVTKFHEQCHVKQMNGNGRGFSCPVCISQKPATINTTEIFPKWGKFSIHLWKEHKIDCELYACSVCKQFKSNLITKVKEHEKLHNPQANYKCETCHKTFKQSKQLRTHEKYHKETKTKLPPPEDARWYTPKECPICQRILSDSKCLKKHISAVHNKLKPYVCNICGHTSARKAELQLHIRQHTGEKPYKCTICPFVTGDHNSLRNHKMRHNDQRPYACPYCDYRCIQSSAFKKHIVAVHPGQEVVFLCQLCSHASVNELLFAAHQKDHEEGGESTSSNNDSNQGTSLNSEEKSKNSSNAPEAKSKTKRCWLDDEDDSVEMVVDTGGITIPAPEVEMVEFESEGMEMNKQLKDCKRSNKSESGEHAQSTEPSDVMMGTEMGNKSVTLQNESCFAKPTMTLLTHKVFDSDESANHYPTEPARPTAERLNIVSEMCGNGNSNGKHQQTLVNLPHPQATFQIHRPLDLSDIICNDSSNDGTLERLLGIN